MTEVDVPDSETLMAQLRQQQQEVAQLQRSIDALVVKGYSRGNEVTVTVRGTGKVAEISIDPELPRRYDAHDLGAIVAEAVNDGLGKLAAATSAKFAPLLDGVPPTPA
jgi:nucleoid-associated protein EbfC